MAAQDDRRETEMRMLFNLELPPGRKRDGLDAELTLSEGDTIPFELKSTTDRSISTVRDFGPHYASKWEALHWLFAFYEKDGTTLKHCYYASPAQMGPWIEDMVSYVSPDFGIADLAPRRITNSDLTEILGPSDSFSIEDAKRVMKRQWRTAQYRENADLPNYEYSRGAMLELLRARARYILERGSTLNNPHISEQYLIDNASLIQKGQPANQVFQLATAYRAAHPL